MENMVVVVGDKFANFTQNKQVITISDLEKVLAQVAQSDHHSSKLTLVRGQGISDAQFERIHSFSKSLRTDSGIDISHWKMSKPRASLQQAHKHNIENVLVSVPRQIQENVFELDVLIDDRCELMSDHQTGQHLSGTLLFEVARQTCIVVTESAFLPYDGKKHSFILDVMGSGYNHYCFPIETKVRYTIEEQKIRASRRYKFQAAVLLEQSGNVVASFTAKFSAFIEGGPQEQEHVAANDALVRYLSDLKSSAVVA